MRTLQELVNLDEPGMRLVEEWVRDAVRPVELLPCAPEDGIANLLRLQITTRSPLGALAYESGGVLVDHGWLRILGAPSERLPRGLADWNRIEGPQRMPGAMLVADDVLGGCFAINGGGLPGASGRMFYGAPDTLEWEALEIGYSAWLDWTFRGDLDGFYESFRWPAWTDEVRALRGDQGLVVYPLLCTEGPPIAERHRGVVPFEELWSLGAAAS